MTTKTMMKRMRYGIARLAFNKSINEIKNDTKKRFFFSYFTAGKFRWWLVVADGKNCKISEMISHLVTRDDLKLNVDNHLFMNIRVSDNRTEFVEGYFTIFVFVCEHNSLIDYLLKLSVLQVVSHHHFQHLQWNDVEMIESKLQYIKLENRELTWNSSPFEMNPSLSIS